MPGSREVTGRVAAVRNWKSGKGWFLVLEDDAADYYGVGMCKVAEGEHVRLTVSPGSGKMAGKWKVDQHEKPDPLSSGPVSEVRSNPGAPNAPATGAPVKGFSRSDSIARAVALKAAVQLVLPGIIPEAKPEYEYFARQALKVARIFEAYLSDEAGGEK